VQAARGLDCSDAEMHVRDEIGCTDEHSLLLKSRQAENSGP
jgi:hypothetical protein